MRKSKKEMQIELQMLNDHIEVLNNKLQRLAEEKASIQQKYDLTIKLMRKFYDSKVVLEIVEEPTPHIKRNW